MVQYVIWGFVGLGVAMGAAFYCKILVERTT